MRRHTSGSIPVNTIRNWCTSLGRVLRGAPFLGIGLINQDKPDEALIYLEKAITRFPQSGDAYYYRALVRLRKGDTAGAKADLTKFLELAPNAPEAPAARKALEQIRD